jgi:hypothetical protein
MAVNLKYVLIIFKMAILLIIILSPFNYCRSQENKSSYVSDNYKLYYDNRSLRDSIIMSQKIIISKDKKGLEPYLLLGMIYMNENKYDSAIIYLKDVNGLHLERFKENGGFYTNAAFLLLDAYRYSYRFKELFDIYSLYWQFLQQDEYKEKLTQFDENLKKNIRWWFIDFARQIALSELGQSPDSYVFGYANENNFELLSKDNGANRLIQNRTEKEHWASVFMLPIDTSAKFYYCFYFNDFKLNSYIKILQNDFNNTNIFTKEKVNTLIKPIVGMFFKEEKESFSWKCVDIKLDSDEDFEVLMYESGN